MGSVPSTAEELRQYVADFRSAYYSDKQWWQDIQAVTTENADILEMVWEKQQSVRGDVDIPKTVAEDQLGVLHEHRKKFEGVEQF